jgi:hypothetical protein
VGNPNTGKKGQVSGIWLLQGFKNMPPTSELPWHPTSKFFQLITMAIHYSNTSPWPPAGWTNSRGLYRRDLPPLLSFMDGRIQSL